MGEITMKGWQCERCQHRWVPRDKEYPRVCPRCKSPYWDTKRGSVRKSQKVSVR